MSTAATPLPAARTRRAATDSVRRLALPLPELGALVVLTAVLNLWALDRNGWANDYYSAAVRSMSSSWHNFLFASFDPSGVMTVDKPPLALWVQALSVKLFGFHSMSILVPQALMGVASVALVYDLTRRLWGRPAGFVAGLVLALTPITVAISRHNNPDALLVLCCVGALWSLVRGLQDGRTRWIVLSGVCIGLGFETKMGAALLVVPALALAWLWFAPRGLGTAVRQLLAGGAAMVVVGGAWPLLMALTPASSRPWISGTTDNSILSLILDYNGLGRLDGQLGGPGGGGPGGGGPGGGTTFGGASGPFRLLNEALGGQASWLLGFAVVALVALVIATRLRRSDARAAWLIATGGTFAITAIAFSEAKGIFHPYYVAQLAPFTAALVGAGTGWFLARRGAGIAAAFALAAGVVTELVVLHQYPGQLTWLPGVLIALGLVVALGLIAVRTRAVRAALLAAALGLLLLAPASWAVQTLGHATQGTFPAGGPATIGFGGGPGGRGGGPGGGPGGGGGFAPPSGGNGFAPPGATQGGATGGQSGGFGGQSGSQGGQSGGLGGQTGGFGGGGPFGDSGSLTAALQYVQQHGGGTIAVSSQTGASTAIIQSGADVAGIGGFSGRESEVTAQWLAAMVREGRIRWVIASGNSGGFGGNDGRVGSSKVMAAVAQVGKQVTLSDGTTLYDLSGQADALAAAS
ncbi:MAG TPA: glycosyltransferase family 39 protein [Solirubrobacteraceae bacterium]|nr:glycosyltransferase family 39 protein [Solirubrobacteraceae bacterium]